MRPLEPGLNRLPNDTCDPEAFRVLLKRTSSLVAGMARRWCRCEADVDDVSQAVYLVVVRKLHAFDESRSTRAWVAAITRRELLARARNPSRQMLPEIEPDADALGHDFEFENAEVWRVVLGAVRKLPAMYRIVIELHYIEGLDSKRIGQQLEMDPSTVRTQLRRAIGLLRNSLPAGLAG